MRTAGGKRLGAAGVGVMVGERQHRRPGAAAARATSVRRRQRAVGVVAVGVQVDEFEHLGAYDTRRMIHAPGNDRPDDVDTLLLDLDGTLLDLAFDNRFWRAGRPGGLGACSTA